MVSGARKYIGHSQFNNPSAKSKFDKFDKFDNADRGFSTNFSSNIRAMGFDGAGADTKMGADLFGGIFFPNKADHFQLAWSKF
jgi:hypothetical protein